MKKLIQKNLDTSLKLVVKSSIIGVFGVILAKIFAFVYRMLIAKYFGPEVYGLFSLSLIIIAWFIAFASLGLSEGLLRYISLFRGKNEINKIRYILNYSLKFLLVSSLIGGLLLFFTARFIATNLFHDAQLIIFLKIFAIAFPILIYSEVGISVIRSFERVIAHSFISDIFSNLVKPLILIILIWFGIKSNAVILSYVLGSSLVLLVVYCYCKYLLSKKISKINLNLTDKQKIKKELFAYSWPLMLVGIISTVLFWSDSLLVGYFKGVFEVGIYNAAVPIATLLFMAPTLFIRLFFPLITREYSKKNFLLIRELSKQVGKWIFILNLPILMMILLFPQAVINVLFGNEYLISANPLRFLAMGALLFSIALVSNNLVSMTGRSKIILMDLIFVNIFNIILDFILIPLPKIISLENSNGLNGAAIATMLSLSLYSFLLFFQSKKYAGVIPLRTKLINVVLASIIPIIFIIFIKKFIGRGLISILILSFSFLFMYLFFVLLFRGFDKNDIMIVSSIKDKLLNSNKIISKKINSEITS